MVILVVLEVVFLVGFVLAADLSIEIRVPSTFAAGKEKASEASSLAHQWVEPGLYTPWWVWTCCSDVPHRRAAMISFRDLHPEFPRLLLWWIPPHRCCFKWDWVPLLHLQGTPNVLQIWQMPRVLQAVIGIPATRVSTDAVGSCNTKLHPSQVNHQWTHERIFISRTACCIPKLCSFDDYRCRCGITTLSVRVDLRLQLKLVLRFNVMRSEAMILSPVKLAKNLRLKSSIPPRHRPIRQSRGAPTVLSECNIEDSRCLCRGLYSRLAKRPRRRHLLCLLQMKCRTLSRPLCLQVFLRKCLSQDVVSFVVARVLQASFLGQPVLNRCTLFYMFY